MLQSDLTLFKGGFGATMLHSDHAPIFCIWDMDLVAGPRWWHFQRSWCITEGYIWCVTEACDSINVQPLVYNLHQKLKAVRGAFIKWNRDFFGNIFDRKSTIEVAAADAMEALVWDWDQGFFLHWHDLKHQWHEMCAMRMCIEAKVSNQKSLIHWFQEGDANTKFFHVMARLGAAAACVDIILNDSGRFPGNGGYS